jgi:hypothetical protein
MNTQTTAQKLADELEQMTWITAVWRSARELRRLHEVEQQRDALQDLCSDELRRLHEVEQQRDELLAVLKRALPQLIGPAYQSAVRAIAKVEGNQ